MKLLKLLSPILPFLLFLQDDNMVLSEAQFFLMAPLLVA